MKTELQSTTPIAHDALIAKEAKDRAEAEAKEEAENAERDKKHVGGIRRESKEDLMAIGIGEQTAKKIVIAISNGDIKNITINY